MIAFFMCLWFYIKKKEYRTTVFLFAFVLARILFDVTVLPARRVDAEERKAFESVVKDVIRKAEGEQVYLLADKKNFEFDLPAMGEVSFSEVRWPDFGLSYYYSKNANEILSYSENSQGGQFFLTLKEYYDEKLIPEGVDSFTTLGEYYIPKRDQTYLLLKAE